MWFIGTTLYEKPAAFGTAPEVCVHHKTLHVFCVTQEQPVKNIKWKAAVMILLVTSKYRDMKKLARVHGWVSPGNREVQVGFMRRLGKQIFSKSQHLWGVHNF